MKLFEWRKRKLITLNANARTKDQGNGEREHKFMSDIMGDHGIERGARTGSALCEINYSDDEQETNIGENGLDSLCDDHDHMSLCYYIQSRGLLAIGTLGMTALDEALHHPAYDQQGDAPQGAEDEDNNIIHSQSNHQVPLAKLCHNSHYGHGYHIPGRDYQNDTLEAHLHDNVQDERSKAIYELEYRVCVHPPIPATSSTLKIASSLDDSMASGIKVRDHNVALVHSKHNPSNQIIITDKPTDLAHVDGDAAGDGNRYNHLNFKISGYDPPTNDGNRHYNASNCRSTYYDTMIPCKSLQTACTNIQKTRVKRLLAPNSLLKSLLFKTTTTTSASLPAPDAFSTKFDQHAQYSQKNKLQKFLKFFGMRNCSRDTGLPRQLNPPQIGDNNSKTMKDDSDDLNVAKNYKKSSVLEEGRKENECWINTDNDFVVLELYVLDGSKVRSS